MSHKLKDNFAAISRQASMYSPPICGNYRRRSEKSPQRHQKATGLPILPNPPDRRLIQEYNFSIFFPRIAFAISAYTVMLFMKQFNQQ